jgi:hypothetical protein
LAVIYWNIAEAAALIIWNLDPIMFRFFVMVDLDNFAVLLMHLIVGGMTKKGLLI